MVKVAGKVQEEEPAREQGEESGPEAAARAGWVEKDSDLRESAYVLSAEREHLMNGGYPAMSRSVRSAIHL
ncbi:MAG: hypothetical protein PHU49_05115 [Syntrophorhabdaceae bacterium]|nr:hypothetical protein [Syntrophorhabdaceae bacterium]